jgi:hypothetical protein
VAGADTLSDQRHDKAQEASELQAKLDQRERLSQQLAVLRKRQGENAQAQATFAEDWQARATVIGLAGMVVTQVSDWRAAQERTLLAAEAVAEARQALEELREVASSARSALANELRRELEGIDSLSALVQLASEAVDAASRAQERRIALAAQKARAEIALEDITSKLTQARTVLDVWRTDWEKRLGSAHLPAGADTGTVEGALNLFERMDDHLRQMRELRTARIDAMQRDLDDFTKKAGEFARTSAPELLDQSADQVARILAQRLAEASEADKERRRLQQELDEARKQSASAVTRIQEAQAELIPLLHLVGVSNNDELRAAIERSDVARSLTMACPARLWRPSLPPLTWSRYPENWPC